MPQINYSILEAAFNDSLITELLSPNKTEYLNDHVVTANRIYWLIKSWEEGLTLNQVSRMIGIHKNTAGGYCRWLNSKGLIRLTEFQARKGRLLTHVYSAV